MGWTRCIGCATDAGTSRSTAVWYKGWRNSDHKSYRTAILPFTYESTGGSCTGLLRLLSLMLHWLSCSCFHLQSRNIQFGSLKLVYYGCSLKRSLEFKQHQEYKGPSNNLLNYFFLLELSNCDYAQVTFGFFSTLINSQEIRPFETIYHINTDQDGKL